MIIVWDDEHNLNVMEIVLVGQLVVRKGVGVVRKEGGDVI